MHRSIIHVHISAFPIAVARVVSPALRERPVAVAPLHSERGLVMSASPEARKEGVFEGMAVSKAVKRCPNLKVLGPDPGLTERAARALAGLTNRYTPLWEASRPGDIDLDITGTQRLWGHAKDTALRLNREIKEELCLPAAVGVAGNKMVSGIASRIMPSGETLDISHGREAHFMAPLNVGLVPGIGRSRKKFLAEELNILRVRELALLDMGRLRLVFGSRAFLIRQRALGIDPTPVRPRTSRPFVYEESRLNEDETDDKKILGIVYSMVERCNHSLRRQGLFPKKAELLIRYADGAESKRRAGLPCAAFRDFDLSSRIEGLYFKACTRRVRIRFIRIVFWELFHDTGQLWLFPELTPVPEKETLITQAVDRIRQRYGEASIRYGKAA